MRAFYESSLAALWVGVAGWLAAVSATADVQVALPDGVVPPPSPHADVPAPQALASSPRVLNREKDGSFPRECDGETVACIPKCCPLGFTLQERDCVPTDVPFEPYIYNRTLDNGGLSLELWPNDSYSIVVGKPCNKAFRENYTMFDVLSTGMLILYKGTFESEIEDNYSSTCFCLEYTGDTEAIICYDQEIAHVSVGFTGWLYTSGMVVSVSGLLLTLVVYLAVDAIRDLHGKSLICHVGCLAVAYVILAAVQLSGASGFGPDACRRVAFAIQFFLMSSFLWLHVMCLDAFWCVLEATQSSPIPYPRAKKWVYDKTKKRWVTGLHVDEVDEAEEQERQRRDKMVERRVFIGYSVYAWTLSFLPVLVVVFHNLNPTIPATYVDYNMKQHCEIYSDRSKESLFYFYPFTALFIVVNVVVFICILIKAVTFKWNVTGPQRVPKQKARMCFLLFVLMSSNWVIDLISWALGGVQVVWVMLHAFYILQGLITFLIFVLEDRVKDRIIHKLWPTMRRINREYGCFHRPREEEEATVLQVNGKPNNKNQTIGWDVTSIETR